MKKLFTLSVLLVAASAAIYLSSCKSKKPAAKTSACASTPTYTADIKKIFDSNCLPCHSAQKHKHGIDLSAYEPAKAAGANKSLLGSVRHEAGYEAMPMEHEKLDDATIEKISCWIQNGMKQ